MLNPVILAASSRGLCLLAVLLGIGAAAPALADREIVLTWSHSEPATVDGFRIHTRVGNGAYDAGTDVALPPRGADGRYAAAVQIPEGVTVSLRLSAYNAAGASPLSEGENAYFFATGPEPLGQPGRPGLVSP